MRHSRSHREDGIVKNPGTAIVCRSIIGSAIALIFFGAVCTVASGQTKPPGGPTPSPEGAVVYFVDLKDGAIVPTKLTVHFGLKNMGIAPAGTPKENAGHHHLLIDSELTAFDQPIPNDAEHLHFGAGQTEAEITLSPGAHVLQLVLGDKDHIPHSPPVVSERIRIVVVEGSTPPAQSGRKPSPADAKVYFVYPHNGSYVTRTPVIRFGLLNMGVAPAGINKPNTGHHHLLIDAPLPPLDQPIPNDANHLHFGAGQTEAKISLPLGKHTLRLVLADENHVPHDPPVYSEPIKITVTVSGRPPSRARPATRARSTTRARR